VKPSGWMTDRTASGMLHLTAACPQPIGPTVRPAVDYPCAASGTVSLSVPILALLYVIIFPAPTCITTTNFHPFYDLWEGVSINSLT
jgi:hypothetical protein